MEPSSFQIRDIRREDLAFLGWDDASAVFRHHWAGETWEKYTRGDILWVIADDGQVVGQVRATLPQSSEYAYIHGLMVRPDHRRQGIGTRLIEEVERRLAPRGHPGILISVGVDNALARTLYERLGYRAYSSRTDRWSFQTEEGPMEIVEDVVDLYKRFRE